MGRRAAAGAKAAKQEPESAAVKREPRVRRRADEARKEGVKSLRALHDALYFLHGD